MDFPFFDEYAFKPFKRIFNSRFYAESDEINVSVDATLPRGEARLSERRISFLLEHREQFSGGTSSVLRGNIIMRSEYSTNECLIDTLIDFASRPQKV